MGIDPPCLVSGGGDTVTRTVENPTPVPTAACAGSDLMNPDEVSEESVEALTADNRNFMKIELAGQTYTALFDPGATISLVGPKLARRFEDRLEENHTWIRSATGDVKKVLGTLKINLDVDRQNKELKFRAIAETNHDMILGMDFGLMWDIQHKIRDRMWRSTDRGVWHKFAEPNDDGLTDIYGECAGIMELDRTQKEIIKDLIAELLPEQAPDNLGATSMTEHSIRVTDEKPIKHAARRMSPKMWQVAKDEVTDMFTKGIIEKSASDWRSAPVIVKKSDNSARFCIDYRDLNKRTVRDAYPLPSIDSILDKLRRARFISKIDLKQAYFQVPMESSSRKYTAFSIPGSGLFQFTRMPFGLTNAPMTFQRLIDAIFGPEYEPYIFGYLDDIIVTTETFEEHVKWLRVVLEKLKEAGLSVNRKKCEFGCSQVRYLGYLLDNEGLRADPEKIAPILNFPEPTNKTELRSFLGMVGYYARFLDNDSEIKLPLLKLLSIKQHFHWGEEQQEAFDQLKLALTRAPVLARPDFSLPFIIQCDASSYAIGAVLCQEFEDGEHPIVFASRVLNPAERNYTVTEKECLAVIWSIKKFRPYVEGYSFVVITDHSALKWLFNLKDPTGRLARWALELQQWDFEIRHKKGALHRVPDALSRAFGTEERAEAFEEIEDEWYIRRLEDVRQFPAKFQKWKVEDNMLYRYRYDPLLDPITFPEESWKLVVPEEHRDRILRDAHREASSGHLGREKTYDRVAREYYWPGVWHDVVRFVKECEECQRYKISQTGPQGLMGHRIVERPWAMVAADMMEFPLSKGQYKYILVFQDLFTRWVEMKPLRNADGKSVARAFEELILFRWETPDYLLTDNGKEFDNKHLDAVLDEYGVKHVATPPYHPQANPVERSNRTLKTMIATFVGTEHKNWDQHLHELRHAINTATQASTKVSPAFLNYGRHPTPVKSLRREVEQRGPKLKLEPEVWADRVRRLDALRDLAGKFIEEARDKQTEYYNRGRKNVSFNVGDMVLRRVHVLSNAANRFSAKLAPKYEGPFEIVRVKSPCVYVLKVEDGRKNANAHVSELKRYIPPRGVS